MSDQAGPPYPYPPAAPAPVPGPGPSTPGRAKAAWLDPVEVREGAFLMGVLAVLGAVLGVVWELWTPARPRAYVITPGKVANDTTEAFVAGDGRYAFLAASIGLVSALVVYFARKGTRGPVTVAALAAGNLTGSLLMWGVGRLLGGGQADGKANTLLAHTTLTVHSDGLVFLQAGLAVLIYGVLVSFARDDDLGRPDPAARRNRAPASVGVGLHPQYPGGDPHAAGLPQQGGFPVQDPRQQQ